MSVQQCVDLSSTLGMVQRKAPSNLIRHWIHNG